MSTRRSSATGSICQPNVHEACGAARQPRGFEPTRGGSHLRRQVALAGGFISAGTTAGSRRKRAPASVRRLDRLPS